MPEPTKPTVPEVLPLVQDYYAMPGNGVGGSLHIVLDDGNVEDASVRHCVQFARENGDSAGVRLAETLLRMSRTQRMKLYCAPKFRVCVKACGKPLSNGSVISLDIS